MSKLLTVDGLVGSCLSFPKKDIRVISVGEDDARTTRLVVRKTGARFDVPLAWLQDAIRLGIITES